MSRPDESAADGQREKGLSSGSGSGDAVAPDARASGRDAARAAVLGRVAAALGREGGRAPTLEERPASVAARLSSAGRHTLPRVEDDLAAQLVRNMEAVLMSVVRLQRPEEVPDAVAFWLDSEDIGGDVTVAPALAKDGYAALDWPAGERDGRTWRQGAASGEESTSVTPCLAGVAETGSVALASGPDTPATLAFLPENHVVVLRAADIVPHVEDVFARLRERGTLPRALNFVTGPSRTADIEQTIEIGAHGPRRMHVLIVEGEA